MTSVSIINKIMEIMTTFISNFRDIVQSRSYNRDSDNNSIINNIHRNTIENDYCSRDRDKTGQAGCLLPLSRASEAMEGGGRGAFWYGLVWFLVWVVWLWESCGIFWYDLASILVRFSIFWHGLVYFGMKLVQFGIYFGMVLEYFGIVLHIFWSGLVYFDMD